ncbi:Smad nuclear-interacting protein 1 [Trypanosoma conorhini]|uniref:Smad nuclear-interacting protein 1 n=1 Tax=Trypanosoma conorhini TaxID=83891 RepID=A0A3R7M5R8_9TRYP|nr:Smad nuclear-interacting protein 1 [Trypanosoma conorhini]RNF09557.1 Smad nuclear-interacting protein 1 [Trypanosoma conorhini]
MERPFYGRTGALNDARQGLAATGSRFSGGRPAKWFPSLLTVPQRVLHSITAGDGVDQSILHLLRVACVYEELRRRHTDGTRHGALLRDVLRWHQISLGQGADCRSAGAADDMFQPYVPAYNICVLKAGQPVATHAAVSRRAVTLVGKDRDVNDIPTDHPSCSAQHAALEVRFVYAHAEALDRQTTACMGERTMMDWGSAQDIGRLCDCVREAMAELGDGADAWLMELQVLDLGSTNGTRLNGERLQPFIPTTLIEGDVLTFGLSTRSYVVVRP